jgi:NAD(P)-dependent dehydrogenase (short-subunit alcohol dehydrogenase family)
LAISRLVIELGGQIVGVDMSASTLQSAAAGLTAGKFVPVVGSVTDQAVAHAAVAAGISAFGSIDGLVNNAGISRPALISKMSMESWQAVMDVMSTGHFSSRKRLASTCWTELLRVRKTPDPLCSLRPMQAGAEVLGKSTMPLPNPPCSA